METLLERHLAECQHILFEMSPSYLIPWWTASHPLQKTMFLCMPSWASLVMLPCWQPFCTSWKSCSLCLWPQFWVDLWQRVTWTEECQSEIFFGSLEQKWGCQSLGSETITYRLRNCWQLCSCIWLSCRENQSAMRKKEYRHRDRSKYRKQKF